MRILNFEKLTLFLLLGFLSGHLIADEEGDAAVDAKRLVELDAYWEKVSKAVGGGDFESYESTCHPEGVLVSGSKKSSQPLADALKRWKSEFDATKAGEVESGVEFRFEQRYGDATTAHETGMFRYWTKGDDGEMKSEYIHFEALLVKRDGEWKILMEYQKSKGTVDEWKALAEGAVDLPAPKD